MHCLATTHSTLLTANSLGRLALALLTTVLLPCWARADVTSGPTAGDPVGALKALEAVGGNAGQEVDYAEARKDKPTVFLFVQAENWSRPMARFLRSLDQELSTNRNDVQIVAVWLTDDVSASKDYLPRAQMSLNLAQTTYAVYQGDKSGPEGWGINPDAHLTVVVVQDQKVSSSIGYLSVNETNVPDVTKALKPKP